MISINDLRVGEPMIIDELFSIVKIDKDMNVYLSVIYRPIVDYFDKDYILSTNNTVCRLYIILNNHYG
jgi:hypothetical protein